MWNLTVTLSEGDRATVGAGEGGWMRTQGAHLKLPQRKFGDPLCNVVTIVSNPPLYA